MAGIVIGIDFREALMRVDLTGIDSTAVRLLLAEGERGIVTGAQRSRDREQENG